jgi:hypothetical protein
VPGFERLRLIADHRKIAGTGILRRVDNEPARRLVWMRHDTALLHALVVTGPFFGASANVTVTTDDFIGMLGAPFNGETGVSGSFAASVRRLLKSDKL